MQSVDGDVRLNVTANVKPAEQTLQGLANDIKKALNFGTGDTKELESGFNRVSQKAQEVNRAVGATSDSKYVNLKNKVQEASDALELAKTKQAEFEAQKVPTEKYARLQSQIKDLQNEADLLYKISEKDAMGTPVGGWENKIEAVRAQISSLIQESRGLVQSGQAYEVNTVKSQQYANAVKKAENNYELANAKLNEYINSQSQGASATDRTTNTIRRQEGAVRSFAKVGNAIKSVMSIANKVAKTIYSKFKVAFKKIVSVAKSALSKVRGLFSHTSKSSNNMFDNITKGVRRGLKMLLRYGLGVRGLFVLFRKLRTAAKEGFKNLGGYSESFNKAVSNLLSASLRLKNSFAAAFQPLASAILPIITKIVNKMSDALTKVGEFMAALTGQKYYYKAVNTTVKYVEKKTKDTVKKVQRYLSPLDDINLFTQKEDTAGTSGADGATDPGKMFTTETVSDKFKKLADKIKALFKSKDWTNLGHFLGESLNVALSKIPWGKINKKAKETATRIYTLINGFLESANWKLIGGTLANGLNVAIRFLSTLVNGLNWKSVGESIAGFINGFFDEIDISAIVNTITGLVNGLATAVLSFSTNINWASIGQKIVNGIVEVFDNIDWGTITLAVTEFASGLGTFINKILGSKKLGKRIGSTIANIFKTAINFVYNLVTTIKFDKIGEAISSVVNAFLEEMAKVDETGLSGWAKLGQSIFRIATGLLTMLITALQQVNWVAVGEAIGDFLSSIDWGQLVLDLGALAGAILQAIANGFAGWYSKDPVSASLAAFLGTVLISGAVLKKITSFASKVTGLLNKFKLPGKSAGGGTTKTMEEVGAEADTVSQGTSKLTSKLTSLIKNLALGIVVIGEVAIAAGLIVGAIWGLGVLLQQVAIAWSPVIQNGNTVVIALLAGTAILAAIGAVCYALGQVGASLIVQLALGIAMLALIGISAALFLAEIWAIGWGLTQILLAWKPVLANGETIAIAIAIGTGILVAIGAVCALLGVAAVASVGLLPLAIGLGIAMLAEIGVAALEFIAEIWLIGKALMQLIIPWSIVIKYGKIIETAIKVGTGLLIAIGVVCALLGVASVASVGLLPLAIALGTKMLKDIGAATVKFVDNLSKIGISLIKMVAAWQPVLENGKTIEQGIKSGTQLLIGIGAVCAVLGAASVVSVGTLPIAIGLGVKMLKDISGGVIDFCNLLIILAKRLVKLAMALAIFQTVLPNLKINLSSFVKFLEAFGNVIIAMAKSMVLSGIGYSIATFCGFFNNNPLSRLNAQINNQYKQFILLTKGLTKIIPLIAIATNLIKSYKSSLGLFKNATSGNGTGLLGTAVSGAKNMANSIISIFTTMANSAIKAINAIVRAANTLKFNIPDWIPDVGGKKFAFNLKPLGEISIPKLATGAVIPPNKQFMAVLGDQRQGKNIEAPEDLIRKIVREETNLGNNTYTVNAQVGAKTLFSVVLDEAKLRQVQTGRSPFEMIKGV